MSVHLVCQVVILVGGIVNPFILGFKRVSIRRWGFIIGLGVQPFWWVTTWRAGQWGIFVSSIWYTLMLCWGIWQHWLVCDDIGNCR